MTLTIEWESPEPDLARGEAWTKTDVGVATIIPRLGERNGGYLKEIVGYHVDVWLFDVRPEAKRRRDDVVGKEVTTEMGARRVANKLLKDNDLLRIELSKPKRKPRRKTTKRGK